MLKISKIRMYDKTSSILENLSYDPVILPNNILIPNNVACMYSRYFCMHRKLTVFILENVRTIEYGRKGMFGMGSE